MFWNITTIHHCHILGKMFYCFACAACAIGSFTNSCERIYNFPSSAQIMNIKTMKSENILVWNTSNHYFGFHKTKHFNWEEKQFKVQRRMWKKLDVTSNIVPGYAVPIRIESLIMQSVLNKWSFPNSGKITFQNFLFADIFFLAVTEKKPLQNHITCFFNYLSRFLR